MCMLERNNVIKSSVSPGLFKIGQTFTMDVRVSSLEHCMCPSCSICFCFLFLLQTRVDSRLSS